MRNAIILLVLGMVLASMTATATPTDDPAFNNYGAGQYDEEQGQVGPGYTGEDANNGEEAGYNDDGDAGYNGDDDASPNSGEVLPGPYNNEAENSGNGNDPE